MALVKEVEGGRRNLTTIVARRISRGTGASASALLKGQAKTVRGDDYTSKAFQRHAAKLKKGKHWNAGVILSWLELVLDVASASKHGARFKTELVTFITEAVRDCELQSAIDRTLAEIPRTIQCALRRDDLAENSQLLKYDINKKDRQVEDLELLETVYLDIPLGDFPRVWTEDMSTPPPPRADSTYGRP